MAPGLGKVLRAARHGLAMAGGGHDRFDHAGEAHFPRRPRELLRAGGEGVGTGGQPQLLGGQAPDPLPVHREPGGPGGGDHADPSLLLQGNQGVGRQRLDLGDHDARPAGDDRRGERLRIAHVDREGVVSHLLGRGALIAVDRRDLHAQAGQGDRHLLADLPGPQQCHLGGARGPGRPDDRRGGVISGGHQHLRRRAAATGHR